MGGFYDGIPRNQARQYQEKEESVLIFWRCG
jgi:hypothetical protein